MGLSNLETGDIEKHLVLTEILAFDVAKIIENVDVFVPYTGAVKEVDLGSQDVTTTGTASLGDVIVGPGGAGDSVINWKVDDNLVYVEGVDDDDSDIYKIAGSSGFGNDDLLQLTTGGKLTISGDFEFGSAGGGVDYTITCNGETNDGVITWMEDEDYWKFLDNILLNLGRTLYFRDTTNYINSSVADQLDIVAATTLKVTADVSQFVSGIIKPISIKTNDYIILVTDHTIVADGTNNTVTITLPASPNSGQIFVIKCKDDTNTVTVARNGKNIDGDASDLTLIEDEVVKLQYDGTEWWII